MFFGSFVWFCIIVTILLICMFFSEKENEGGLGLGCFIIFIAINYFWGNINMAWLLNIKLWIGYILVGFVFCFIRVFFYGRSRAKDYYKNLSTDLKGKVFRWWFMWPISLIYWIFSDLLSEVWDMTYQFFGNMFSRIEQLGMQSIKKG